LKTDTAHFFVMTRDAKMASEGTFEPYDNGINEPAVQRSLSILLMFQHRHAYFQNQ